MTRKIRTFSGKFVDPTNLKVKDICLEDIEHGLRNLCRFAGQCKQFYSVYEHSIRVAQILCGMDQSLNVIRAGLLHDASEAYLVDLPSPFKYRLKLYLTWEHKAMKVIYKALGVTKLSRAEQKLIKQADIQALEEEKKELFDDPK